MRKTGQTVLLKGNFISAGCTRGLDSFRWIVDPDSFWYSFWSACTLGCAASSFEAAFFNSAEKESVLQAIHSVFILF